MVLLRINTIARCVEIICQQSKAILWMLTVKNPVAAGQRIGRPDQLQSSRTYLHVRLWGLDKPDNNVMQQILPGIGFGGIDQFRQSITEDDAFWLY